MWESVCPGPTWILKNITNTCHSPSSGGLGTESNPYLINGKDNIGNFAVVAFPISKASVTYFMIDPKNTPGYVYEPTVTKMIIVVEDPGLGMVWAAGLEVTVQELTASGNVVYTYGPAFFQFSSGMARLAGGARYSKLQYDQGNKFRVMVKEKGYGNGTINIKW